MGYYEVLEEIERLRKHNINSFTTQDIANNINIIKQSVRRTLAQLEKEGKIERKVILSNKGTNITYTIINKKKPEGFINDTFNLVADILSK